MAFGIYARSMFADTQDKIFLVTTFVADRSVWSYHRLPDCEQHNSSLSRDVGTFSISGPLYFVKRAAAIGQLDIPSSEDAMISTYKLSEDPTHHLCLGVQSGVFWYCG